MSIVSTLALMATAAVARLKSPDVEITKLEMKVKELTRRLSEVEDEARSWERLTHNWEERWAHSLDTALQRQMATQAQLNQVKYNQHAQTMQAQQFGQWMEGFCNCVPARHDLLIPARSQP